MATNDNEIRQDIKEKYADRLSAGTYAFKKGKEIVISTVGILGGWFGGKAVDKMRGKEPNFNFPIGANLEGKPITVKASVSAIIGAVIGSSISGMIIAYEHWRKMESNKLSIDEINNDVANMKIRQRTDPELLKENDRLREMLEKETAASEALAKEAPKQAEEKTETEVVTKEETTVTEEKSTSTPHEHTKHTHRHEAHARHEHSHEHKKKSHSEKVGEPETSFSKQVETSAPAERTV